MVSSVFSRVLRSVTVPVILLEEDVFFSRKETSRLDLELKFSSAKHPQFDHEMTDYELEYFSERALRPVKARRAAALKNLAALLYQEDSPDDALLTARQARAADPMSEASWEIECNILADAEQFDAAVELMEEKADRFKFFPDVVMQSRQRQADLLARSGDAERAAKTLQLEVARVASKRTDLQQEMVIAQADQLLELGKGHEGLAAIEKVLMEQREDVGGLKVGLLIREYLLYAERAGLKNNAENFLREYYR